METIPLEMDDIFDENDDDVAPTRLPDLEDLDLEGNLEPMMDSRDEPVEGEDEPLTDNPELLAKLKSLKGASKNVQRRTYIKLDATRLTGERGIAVLPQVFKNVKLKGKHHEVEDLKAIMHHLEHWAHRLFPKMPFTEVLERSERLGAKKAVQTCVKRIRLGMPVLADDFVGDEENVRREGDTQRDESEGERNEESSAVTNSSFSNQIPDDDEIDEFLSTAAELDREQAASQSQLSSQRESQRADPSLPNQNQSTNNGNAVLSEEAKARIERNKKLAMERRAARLAKKAGNEETSNATPVSPSPPTTSGPGESALTRTETTGNDDLCEGPGDGANDKNDGTQGFGEDEMESNKSAVDDSPGDECEDMDVIPPNGQNEAEDLQSINDTVCKENESGDQNDLSEDMTGSSKDRNMEDDI